ncbi:hypothetical protein [Jannaschia sp. LMIT008]|uniref:hypothetical protein n=1 Tax=Jannaschia maritima TaxID=3032585 RepID=UPI002811CB6E|nr:hypothetical protein [Jannaschia sp. LMIT008]
MKEEIRPIGTLESTAITFGVACLAGAATFVMLLGLGGWSFLQAAFGAIVVVVVLGLVLVTTIGRPAAPPTTARGGVQAPTEDRARATQAGQPGEAAAPSPEAATRTQAPSPHRSEIPFSMISDVQKADPSDLRAPRQKLAGQPVQAAQATRVPSPAPVNADDPGVARPVGATTDPTPQAQPSPLDGKVVSPEPLVGHPQEIDRNQAAPTGGTAPTPSATKKAQSYNEVEGAGDAPQDGGSAQRVASAPSASVGEPTISGREGAAPAGEVDDRAVTQVDPLLKDDRDRLDEAMHPVADGPQAEPARLDAPRDGKPDDLKQIKGVGPKLETMLNDMGFYHLDQIAAWSEEEVRWVDSNLEGFRGRVSRDEWVEQARTLAGGETTEFSRKVEDGGVY